MVGLKRSKLTLVLTLTLAMALVAGVLSAQVTVQETGLGAGTYEDAGLVRIDEATVVAQTIGSDGFRGSFDDSVAVIRDLGGAPTVTYVGMGVMTPGLIVLDNGVVAAVSSGVDGQIGTLDDALLLVFGASGVTPTKVIVPFGGTFVGGAAMAQSVKTRDLIASASGGRVVLTLSGATVTPASPLADVVLIVDASSPTVSKTYVPTSASLMRSPPTDLTVPGDAHEVLGMWGLGADLIPSTGDDLFVVLERMAPAAPWTLRVAPCDGWGMVDGWQRRPRRFDAPTAVAVGIIPSDPSLIGFSPESERSFADRVSVGFVKISGLSSPQDQLAVDVVFMDEGSRWIPPSPFVRYVSAWFPTRWGIPHDLVEFTDLHLAAPTQTHHDWPHQWGADPELAFYGQGTPVATTVQGYITTNDPQTSGGWHIFDDDPGRTFSLNDGVIVQVGSTGVGWVENLLLGAQASQVQYLASRLLVDSSLVLSSGSVAVLTSGYDHITGNADDGVLFCFGLPGASPIGLGQPERTGGGPKLTVQGTTYPRAISAGSLTLMRDSGLLGATGTWRPGLLLATPSRGFHEFSWGRKFLSFNNLYEIIPIDLAAGVGASGWGVTTTSLPGNPMLAGLDVTLQWIVHNPQSPWLYDTSNGLVVRLGL